MSDANDIYKLYAESAEQTSPIEQTADKFFNLHMELQNVHERMREFMHSEEFQFAVNNDWMGIDEDEAELIPNNYYAYVKTFFESW